MRSTSSLLALCAWASLNACGSRAADPPPDPRADSERPVVVEAVANMSDAAPERFIGVIAPVEAIDLAPPFAGELTDVAVRPGDTVVKGQLVAKLDPRRLREELAVARAALRSARAARRQTGVDVADAKRKLAVERAAVSAGTVSASQLERAKFDLERASAARARASAAVSEERVRVTKANNLLADAGLRAPFSGTVAVRYRDPGAVVGPGAPVLRLIGSGGFRIRFAVPPERAAGLQVGRSLRVSIDTVAQTVPATVRQVAPELDSASKMIFIEAAFDDDSSASKLSPGLAAWVTLN